MNSLRFRNDNHSGKKETATDNKPSIAGINVYGGTINIENLELSITLPDSKKNLTDRAIVLALRELFLSGNTLSKKASYYPQVDSTGPVTDIKKTALARVIQCKEWNTLFHNNEPLSLYAL